MSLASQSLSKSISKQAPEVLPRASRARRFGIDCESELRWHAKEPGGDYKQKLLIKNISNQVLFLYLVCPQGWRDWFPVYACARELSVVRLYLAEQSTQGQTMSSHGTAKKKSRATRDRRCWETDTLPQSIMSFSLASPSYPSG